jgi:hypothetical protein
MQLKGGVHVKRVAMLGVALLSLVFGIASALADDDGDQAGGGTAVTSPVEPAWVISSTDLGGACTKLPANTTITMQTGTQTAIERVKTNDRGITTISNFTHAFGTATDQAGNVYRWDYKNRFRISNTIENPGVFSGRMVDRFSLGGGDDSRDDGNDSSDDDDDDDSRPGNAGPVRLLNGFVAVFTLDVTTGSASLQPITSFGDPISFPDGAAHCDPL